MTSVEVLDYPNAHSWRLGPSLNVARANTHAVVTARNAIYVVGGFDGSQFLDSIEVLENGKCFYSITNNYTYYKLIKKNKHVF